MLLKSREQLAALLVVVALSGSVFVHGAGAASDIPDGFVSGRPHLVRFRPVLSELPAAPRRRVPVAAADLARSTVAACDVAQVVSLAQVPTSNRAADTPSACVVQAGNQSKRPPRYLLGPSTVVGSDVLSVEVEETRPSRKAKLQRTVQMELTGRGTSAYAAATADPFAPPLQVVIDGVVQTGVVVPSEPSVDVATGALLTLAPKKGGYSRDVANDLVGLIDQARSEEVIALAKRSTMTKTAMRIFASNGPRIDEKALFAEDCAAPEATSTFVLGCYTAGEIYILRVDRLDLEPVMVVTAAHEMFHAAYEGLTSKERRNIDKLVEDFYQASTDEGLREQVADYEISEPGQRLHELHSLIGTQSTSLGEPLEKYYRRYFHDRAQIVAAFNSYRSVFDNLEAQSEVLIAEIEALDAQLGGIDAELKPAAAEAERLATEIDSLRSQGRIDESNRLVGPQNAAVDRANSLSGRYNALVRDYNAKVDALNALAIAVRQLDEVFETKGA